MGQKHVKKTVERNENTPDNKGQFGAKAHARNIAQETGYCVTKVEKVLGGVKTNLTPQEAEMIRGIASRRMSTERPATLSR